MDIARLLSPVPDDDIVDTDRTPSTPSSVSSVDDDHAPSSRTGRWMYEEEQFALALIECFLLGCVPDLVRGTSLRCFLAYKLQCSPMRVSKKLARSTKQLKVASVPIPKKLGHQRYAPSVTDTRQTLAKTQNMQRLEFEFLNQLRAANGGHLNAPTSPSSDWSYDEEVFAWKLIDSFQRGHLYLPHDMTLGTYLVEQLRCNPIRIAQKLESGVLAGQAVHPSILSSLGYCRRDVVDRSAPFLV
ncbi:hypothetical protein SPRG_20288 [Saprolegnia parasitica CBS 223.65]|uniref:Uncharacterized protein n=1 Tax=Saprolegnia parasitica (strain CBS 223.65) TaxID=695850 RepID=A0A067CBJ7_SAPPC|nr:hypothetical protein SPRG_20288 [Saprolegnia parasitica CBS 223.65]KDO28129.1 hypothetical protein SPRG_20288 [Saprolegnia parasitica CBS 223.65]|eukprot:XP_012201267.1 hypothetical protein SPRG_20288 [Saprolegnia parasitica CBS 223.65]